MALNFPGPYELRYFYTVDSRVHQLRHSLQLNDTPSVGDAFSTIIPIERDGDAVTSLNTHVDNFVAVFLPFLSSADGAVNRVELWKYTPSSFDAMYVSVYDISLAGTNVAATIPASQVIWTFRTQEGGILKITILDTTVGAGISLVPPLPTVAQNIADYINNNNSIVLGRDTSYPFSVVGYYRGQNERLFKRLYR